MVCGKFLFFLMSGSWEKLCSDSVFHAALGPGLKSVKSAKRGLSLRQHYTDTFRSVQTEALARKFVGCQPKTTSVVNDVAQCTFQSEKVPFYTRPQLTSCLKPSTIIHFLNPNQVGFLPEIKQASLNFS